MEEKRRSKRMEIDAKIKLNLLQNDKDLTGLNKESFNVKLVNVSKDGIGFKSGEELKLNTYYDAELILWTKDTFETVVEIVRMENLGEDETLYGCRFIGIDASDQLKIQIYELVSEFADK